MPQISSFSYKVIYVYTIDDGQHQGMMKIGQTEVKAASGAVLEPDCEELRQAARARINEQTGTAAVKYELQYVEFAHFTAEDGMVYNITDKEVHNVLKNSGYEQATFPELQIKPTEWFMVTNIETIKKAIATAKEGKLALDQKDQNKTTQEKKPEIKFRDEQERAIQDTVTRFGAGNKMLWNAKMRFGKTLCALEVIRRMGYRRTLIITHRPGVRSGWFEDFNLLDFDDSYYFGQRKVALPKSDGTPKQEQLKAMMAAKVRKHEVLEEGAKNENMSYIFFASIQDLRGSKRVGGHHDKNEDLFDTPWDLLIIDEAHEGTVTELGQAVIRELQKRPGLKTLYLSGTPYNIMSGFEADEIYTWDYVMEQTAKAQWEETHPGEPNPYERLPRMVMHRFSLSDDFPGYGLDEENDYFNFAEFFRCDSQTGAFVHEADVKRFLQLLCREDKKTGYPYSTPEFRYSLSHTLWVVPSVDSANALERLLQAADSPLREYHVINVAGDNVNNGESPQAEEKVSRGIAEHSRTITLTVNSGRMTVGVSVPEWSGVFMLSGAAKCKAAGYLQTIFRAQTPTRRGVNPYKTECHAFDFAPDRVLEIVNEIAEQHAKANRGNGQPRMPHEDSVNETLHFVPIIAHDLGRETPLDTGEFMEMVGRSYSEHIARRGFTDRRLFVDLDTLSAEQYRIIGELGNKMRKAKHQFSNASASGAAVELSKTGLDDTDKKSGKSGKGKTGGSNTKEGTPPSGKKKESNGAQALRVLQEIYLRLPMLLFGSDISDDDITLQGLVNNVDEESWQVFMPKGISKDDMQQLLDMNIVQENRFVSAARLVRNETREADKLPVAERVKAIAKQIARFRFPDKETVLTPWRVVNMHMSDTLGGWTFFNEDFSKEIAEPRLVDNGAVTAEAFNPESRILEINSKSGLYPLYVAYSLFRWRREHPGMFDPEDDYELWRRIVAENIYVLCMSEMAAKITKRVLLGYSEGPSHIRAYLKNRDLIEDIKTQPREVEERLRGKNNFWGNNQKEMKFNAIVGNPPYQEEGENTRKAPIYHLFYDMAFKLSDIVTLITPGRYLFRVGQTPKEWMDRMLSNPHFKIVRFAQKSNEIFDNVDIKGGVAIGYYDKNHNFGPIGFFSEFAELKQIMRKVLNTNFSGFAEIVSSQGIYKFSDLALEENPQILEVQGKGTASKIVSQSLEKLPLVFLAEKPEDGKEYIQIFGRIGNQRGYRWVRRDYIQPVDSLDNWKVFVPEANGTGAIGEVLSTPVIGVPVIGVPVIGHTDTFLSIGKFASAEEASACLNYVKSKFARCLLGTLKATQHNPSETWANVPLQDFTLNSDIDWSQSVADIDRQLYKKYNLTDEEIAFIESMIKPM